MTLVANDFNYDGVGRLYRTSSPLHAPASYFFQIVNPNPPHSPPETQPPYVYGTTLNRSERFFYDGTRRVQELITDPLLFTEEGDSITMANELYAGQPGSNVQVAGAPYVRAMYVWGPGDSPTSGVDELLLQIDPRDTGTGAVSAFGGKPWFAVSDAQGDLVALLHKQTASSTARIAAQGTFCRAPCPPAAARRHLLPLKDASDPSFQHSLVNALLRRTADCFGREWSAQVDLQRRYRQLEREIGNNRATKWRAVSIDAKTREPCITGFVA